MADFEASYTCSCGHKINTSFPSVFVLDEKTTQDLKSGEIFALDCPECGRRLKVDAPALFEVPGNIYSVYLIPEKLRNAYLLGKFPVEVPCSRVAVGLKELQEKIRLREDNLDDQTIELLKLSLLTRLKKNMEIFYKETKEEKLVFYVEGLKPGEVGLTSLPLSVYRNKLAEKEGWIQDPEYQVFLREPYVSVSQVDVEDDEV